MNIGLFGRPYEYLIKLTRSQKLLRAYIRFICGFICGVCLVGTYDQYVRVATLNPNIEIEVVEDTPLRKENKRSFSYYNIIAQRDIFNSTHKEPKVSFVGNIGKELNLRLVGTAGPKYAIFENRLNNKQDVFELGEKVFSRAELLEVGKDYADLVFDGHVYRLYIEEFLNSSGVVYKTFNKVDQGYENYFPKTYREGLVETSFRSYQVKKSLIRQVLDEHEKHTSTAASRFVENGIVVYGQDVDSIFREIGLEDSDVITEINGKTVTGLSGAITLYHELVLDFEHLDRVTMEIRRAGAPIKFTYYLED